MKSTNSGKKTKMLSLLLLSILWATICPAQSTNNSLVTFTNWGESVQGIQLSITVTNSTVSVGSSFLLFIEMKNLSTNVIRIGESSPEAEYIVTLTDTSGKEYKITRRPFVFTRNFLDSMNPQEIRNWVLFAEVNKYYEPNKFSATHENIPGGNYTLKATRQFLVSTNNFTLESNPLTIQLK